MLLSILTMTENYPEIWNDLSIPAGLDRQDLIDHICIQNAELELLYTEPDILKYMIRNWSRVKKQNWEKLLATLNFVYDPIYNLDVTWEEERTPDLKRNKTYNDYETRQPDLTESQTSQKNASGSSSNNNTETPADTTTEKVAGYNDATLANSRQTERGGTIGNSGSENYSDLESGSNTIKTTGNETKNGSGSEQETETGKETIITRRYGNQGVTMTQDMIQKEREVDEFNMYEYISKSFRNRFCILVY